MRQILSLHAAFLAGLSPVTLTRHCLARADALSRLNLLTATSPQQALDAAEAAHRRFVAGRPRGPLDGVPFVVKDNFSTAGVPTSCASRALRAYTPPFDATVVSRLRRAGAVLVGKANLDEFAMGCGSVDSAYGPSRNPWTLLSELRDCDDDWFITGGSSGGSAGAVSSGVAVFALGSDTGGSVRNPASYCGVVGLKPSYGRLSRHGLIPLVNSIEQPGVLATSAEDAALVMQTLSGRDPKDSTSLPTHPDDPLVQPDLDWLSAGVQGLRIGIPREYHAPGLSRESLEAWERVAGLLEEGGGCQVEPVSLPHTQLSIKCYSVLNNAEVASNMARYDGLEFGHRDEGEDASTEALFAATRSHGFNEVVRSRVFTGNFFLLRDNHKKYLDVARRVWRLIHDDFTDAFSRCDLLLTPVTLSAARRHSWFVAADSRQRTAVEDVCTQAANLGGVPAISLPVGVNAEGLPVAVQLLGARGDEARLLTAAQWLEEQVQFPQRVMTEVPPLRENTQ